MVGTLARRVPKIARVRCVCMQVEWLTVLDWNCVDQWMDGDGSMGASSAQQRHGFIHTGGQFITSYIYTYIDL